MAIIDSLVSYYKFDEDAANTTVADAHGSNTGTSSSDTEDLDVAGKINTAFYFNAADYVDASGFADSTGSYSFQFWLKPDANTGNQIIFDDDTDSTGDRIFIYSNFDVISDKIGYFYGGSFGDFGVSASTGVWTHVVITLNGVSGKGILYLNGSKQSTEPTYAAQDMGDDITFGAAENAKNNIFDGAMDEVAIWTKVLNQTEITALYNGGDGLAYPFSTIKELSESVTLTDTTLLKSITKNFIETSTLAEVQLKSITKNFTETSTLSDSFTKGFEISLSELVSLIDSSSTLITKIRNKKLGGTDWLIGDVLTSQELTNTFNALVAYIDAGTGPSP